MMFSLGGGVQISTTVSLYATGRSESLLSLTLPKKNKSKIKTKETIWWTNILAMLLATKIFFYAISKIKSS